MFDSLKAVAKAPFRVFVYGTLKQGYNNHHVIEPYNPQLVGKGTVQGFTLLHLGFPGAIEAEDKHITGEVWDCTPNAPAMARCDGLEGVGTGFYDRVAVDVQLEDGTTTEAWMYVLVDERARKNARPIGPTWPEQVAVGVPDEEDEHDDDGCCD